MRNYALLSINGKRHEVRGRESMMMFAEWLRRARGLTGTKIVCAEGDCGACTVLRAVPQHARSEQSVSNEQLRFSAMNSCIAMVAQLDGAHIVTVEGLQSGDTLSPVQQAMQKCHGSQCGFCTPGFVMAISGMLEGKDVGERIDEKEAINHLTGNLCRCTGYAPIIEAALTVDAAERRSVSHRYLQPSLIAETLASTSEPLLIEDAGVKFFAPTTLRDACAFAALNPGFRVLGAATDMGVAINKGRALPKALLSLHLLEELRSVKVTRRRVTVGARASLEDVRRVCVQRAPEFARFLNLFASPQIKNVATLVGNVATGSPIGDTLPFLLVAGGTVHAVSRLAGKGPVKRRSIPMTDLYTGYRTLALQPDEFISHVSFDCAMPNEVTRLVKVSQRKDLDISAVSGAFRVQFTRSLVRGQGANISAAAIAFGGVAATPLRILSAEQALIGELSEDRIESVTVMIEQSIQPISDVRGSAAYRRVLASNIFRKFAMEVLHGN